ncbi:PLC-like phosphodiesterase [Auriscalpium vulgare]|uniref:PLC-like phosphodiesterase n=1 Tax=Auriscalpium vulgare TaxID=40419 RepID=A0ACB8RZ90_9AGAM|nr:PLC-like phosphodiesterase [Auriscalpium vulgare]
MSPTTSRTLPECWGHRGASAALPENTLASFEAAIREGSEGIESDVHVSQDNVVLMFHDPSLERTTNYKGLIRERVWYGQDGMEHARTTKEPKQSIPTFVETVSLLMQPENRHVKFNVDVKVWNDSVQLFTLMHEAISSYPDWETLLAPRLVLGLWHPRALAPAKAILPYCKRSHIGFTTDFARKYFWNDCDAFSMWFPCLTSVDGEKFRNECKSAGKHLYVWTVNSPVQMVEATRWGVDAILTDVPNTWLNLRKALGADYDQVAAQYTRSFLWTGPMYYSPFQTALSWLVWWRLQKVAGSFEDTESSGQAAAVQA